MHANAVTCVEARESVPTHELTPAGPIPTAFDPDGVYPYLSYVETADRPVPKKYGFVVLENAKIRVTVCPDRGGTVTSIVHKRSGKEVLYAPDVIKPTRILPRFAFVAGGIEVSFPISHSPTQNEPVSWRVDRTNERIYLSCGERELRFGMQWSVEYSLGPGDDFLTQRAVFHNPGPSAHPWMSWSNAAIPSAPDTQYHFPKGKVLAHSSTLQVIDWHPKQEADIKEMTGFFWQTRDGNAFGAFTPSLGVGLYHIADEAIAPGMKLWSYGIGQDREWAGAGGSYAEIQGGPIRDQSIKLELAPKETRWHVEFWIPADKPLDIHALKVPQIELRPISDVPLFDWAREREVKVWRDLVRAYQTKGRLPPPKPPEIDQCVWPPSGMADLNAAFKWAIGTTSNDERERWKFYHGAWLAGRGKKREATEVLAATRSGGVATALLARLLAMGGEIERAAQALGSIQEQWLQLHPQVVVARDAALRALGAHTLAEREQWLSRVDAVPDDDRIRERRVQLLIDKGELQAAKRLLLSAPFQKVHQRYVRTALWKQICEAPIPAELGEDRLAAFGAYREFE